MEIALLLARLVLAVVFGVAATAKLLDRGGSRQAVADFGVPSRLAAPVAALLPLVELAVAGSLIPGLTAWWAALGALALLLLFVAAIGVSLARGRRPACRCFGQLSSSPVGSTTLARNGILAAAGGFVVWQGADQPGLSAVDTPALSATELGLIVGGLVLLGLLAAEAVLLVSVLHQNGRVLLRLDRLEESLAAAGIVPSATETPAEAGAGLPVGSPAPDFQLAGVWGETLTLDSLRAAGKPVMLIFTDPACGPCNALLPEISRWQRAHAGELPIALVSRGDAAANRAKSAEHGVSNVLVQTDAEVSQAYAEGGTPSAVIVRPDGRIGSSLAAGADAIRALLARTIGQPAEAASAPESTVPAAQSGNGPTAAPPPSAPTTGQPAPPVKLPDLKGRTINLAGYRGRRTLVLFWNPACGFCQQMLEDLKAWEADPPEEAPKLLVVSTGSVEANEALGLRSPVLLDQDFSVASTFGANGTPMAVLVDEEGRIGSGVAAGAQSVLALARAEAQQHGAGV